MFFKKRFSREIVITPSSNAGFIVNVGCCIRVYTNIESLINDLGDFLEDPEKAEREYHKMTQLDNIPEEEPTRMESRTCNSN